MDTPQARDWSRRRFLVASSALLGASCGARSSRPPEAAHALGNEVQRAAARDSLLSAGTRTYRGEVSPKEGGPALFSYERRVTRLAKGLRSAHVTYAPQGSVVVLQSALHDEHYQLSRFDEAHLQAATYGSVVLNGEHVQLCFEEQGQAREASERVEAPVVVGPTLFGFLLRHREVLRHGGQLEFRFAVLSRLETIGFVAESEPGEGLRVRLVPESAFIRLLVYPLTVEFDARGQQLRRYVGPVPPLRERDGELEPFDASVRYFDHVARFL